MKSAINDLSCLAGLAALTRAGWIIHPALAWCVAGVALFCFGVGRAQLAMKEKQS